MSSGYDCGHQKQTAARITDECTIRRLRGGTNELVRSHNKRSGMAEFLGHTNLIEYLCKTHTHSVQRIAYTVCNHLVVF